jgi:hypothetical protein
MEEQDVIKWLLGGDPAIQYQTHRDLLGKGRNDIQAKIEKEGWGKRFLSFRSKSGHWGKGFYQPKWISSHYTLLDLKNLAISPDCAPIRQTLNLILDKEKGDDGGLYPIGTPHVSDVCVNGMALNYLSYFRTESSHLKSIVDFILSQKMDDGGFNCYSNRKGAVHSSLHSTLSVLEGFLEFRKNNYTHRLQDIRKAERESQEFLLKHRLFRSHRTGEIIDRKMLVLSYPSRWRYDILRALDYFQSTGVAYDKRMQDALDVIVKKRTRDNVWALQANHPGQFHFHMEKVGKPSHWNTLRALRVLKYFKQLEV